MEDFTREVEDSEKLQIKHKRAAIYQRYNELMDEELEVKKRINTEKLSLAIQLMVYDILTRHNGYAGEIGEVSLKDISKFGKPNETSWIVNDERVEVILDYSYELANENDFTRLKEGLVSTFKEELVDWKLLFDLLQKEDITINHVKRVDDESDVKSFTDLIVVVFERTKKYDYETRGVRK